MPNQPPQSTQRDNCHKAIVIHESAFRALKAMQMPLPDEPLQVRFDLKDIATAVFLEALNLPEIRERARMRALAVINQKLKLLNEESNR